MQDGRANLKQLAVLPKVLERRAAATDDGEVGASPPSVKRAGGAAAFVGHDGDHSSAAWLGYGRLHQRQRAYKNVRL